MPPATALRVGLGTSPSKIRNPTKVTKGGGVWRTPFGGNWVARGCIRWMVVGQRGRDGLSCWLQPRPCRHDVARSNPMCHGSRRVRGHAPAPPESTSMRNRGAQRTFPLCSTRVGDSLQPHRSLCNSSGLVRGHYDTVSAFGYVLLPIFPDETGLRRAGGVAPLHPPPGCPWTRFGRRPTLCPRV